MFLQQILNRTGPQDLAQPQYILPMCSVQQALLIVMLASAKVAVTGLNPNDLRYKLTNIQPEYEALHDMGLAQEARSTHLNSKAFM